MEFYIQQIRNFKGLRNDIEKQRLYLEECCIQYTTPPNLEKLYLDIEKIQSYKVKYDEVPNDFYEFAEKVDDHYIIKNYKKNKWTTFGYMYRDYDDDGENENYNENEEELQYSENELENLKMTYKMCIDKIKELGIDIMKVDFELSNYQNRNSSSLCGGCTVFVFYCKKNHYNFTIEFDDDCDCEPGILYVRKVLNTLNNEKYAICCDLFCHNTGDAKLKNFMCLLECENKEHYFENRYGKFFKLNQLLNEKNLESKYLNENFLPEKDISINNFNYNLVYDIKSQHGNCYIVPVMRHNEDYMLYIVPDINYIKENDKNDFCVDHNRQMDVNSFNFDFGKYSICFDYKDENQIDELVELINIYTKFLSNNFGYYEGDRYYNHYDLKEIADKHYKQYGDDFYMKYHIETHCNYDPKSDYQIDFLFKISSKISTCESRGSYIVTENYILSKNFNPDGICPRDCYYITVKYNPNLDNDYCELKIHGLWYNINYDFKKEYYTLLDENYLVDKKNDINYLEPVTIKAKFTEIHKIIDDFVNMCLE